MDKKIEKFKNLSFEDFKELAKDDSLSKYEKIGFPDDYRKGKDEDIFRDIVNKLGLESSKNTTIVDIGIGCSDLSDLILQYCEEKDSTLVAIDSKEMLDLIPDNGTVIKIEGFFPSETSDFISNYLNKVDAIICYSIFHYVFGYSCIYKFIDSALSLLKPGGKLLIGDIPNISKRKRFFNSDTGIEFHKQYTQSDELPIVEHLVLESDHIDDGIMLGIIQRYRGFGFDAYILPQNSNLPMYNRREDILICKN